MINLYVTTVQSNDNLEWVAHVPHYLNQIWMRKERIQLTFHAPKNGRHDGTKAYTHSKTEILT